MRGWGVPLGPSCEGRSPSREEAVMPCVVMVMVAASVPLVDVFFTPMADVAMPCL